MKTMRALASLITLAAAVPAAEIAPGLTLDGWVDTTFRVVNTPNYLPNATLPSGVIQVNPYSGSSPSTDFASRAALTAGYTIAERVQANIGLWFNNDGSAVELREASIVTDLGRGLAWQIGKTYNHLGWIAGDPTGLFRVNESTIDYTGVFYGAVDPLGTSLAWTSPAEGFTAALFITNGFYNDKDGDNLTSIDNGSIQAKNDLGFGLDLIGRFGADQASEINLECAWDAHGGAQREGGKNGPKYQVGLNTTIKPAGEADPLTLGAEIIALATAYDDLDGNLARPGQTTRQEVGVMAMASDQVRQQSSWPMALTGMYQRMDPYWDSTGPSTWTSDGVALKDGRPYYHNDRVAVNEVSLGLLTNPFQDTAFALNFELAYAFVDGGAANPAVHPVQPTDPRDGVTTVAIEVLAVIP
jgi:hypothetical protein